MAKLLWKRSKISAKPYRNANILFSWVPLYISSGWKMEALFWGPLLLETFSFIKHLKQKTGRDSDFGMKKVPVNLPTAWFRNASLVGFIEGISIKINWPLCYLALQTRFVSLYSGHDPQINFCLGSKWSVCHWIKDLNGGFVYWASKLAPVAQFNTLQSQIYFLEMLLIGLFKVSPIFCSHGPNMRSRSEF